MITEDSRKNLAEAIAKHLRMDFAEVFLSGNLRETITIEKSGNDWKVHIPAVRYDIQKFKDEGVIIKHPEEGSYAEAVNKSGGFSKKHKNYVERALEKAITEWLGEIGVKSTSVKTIGG